MYINHKNNYIKDLNLKVIKGLREPMNEVGWGGHEKGYTEKRKWENDVITIKLKFFLCNYVLASSLYTSIIDKFLFSCNSYYNWLKQEFRGTILYACLLWENSATRISWIWRSKRDTKEVFMVEKQGYSNLSKILLCFFHNRELSWW